MSVFDTPGVQVQPMQPPDYMGDIRKKQEIQLGNAQLQNYRNQQIAADRLIQRNQVIDQLRQKSYTDPNAMQQLAGISPDDAKKVQDDIFTRSQRAATYATTINQAPRNQKPAVYKSALEMARNDPLIDQRALAALPAEYSPAVDAQLYTISQSHRTLEDSLKAGKERADLDLTGAKTKTEGFQQANYAANTNKTKAETMDILNKNNPNYIAEKERAQVEGKQFGEANVKYINDIFDKGQAAFATNQQLDNIQSGLDTIGTTGITSNLKNNLSSFANQAGVKIDVDKLGTTQQVQAAINKIVLGQVKASGLGSGNGFTDTDREFLASTLPKLTSSPEGNTKIITYLKKINQRDVEVANLTQQLKEAGITDRGAIQRSIQSYAKNNPLFDEDKKRGEVAQSKAANAITGGQSFKASNGLNYTVDRK